MKTIELRSLISGIPKVIKIPYEIEQLFHLWKKIANKDEVDPLESFYAGYILSNPNVKDKFKMFEEKKKMILGALIKFLCGLVVYVFIMFSLTIAIGAGVNAGLKTFFNKKTSK